MKKIEIKFPVLPFGVQEALNKLRINIKFTGASISKIMVTSSLPNEGKSFISIHLWKMLAEAGFPTVFVDLDLRNSVLKDKYCMEIPEKENAKGIDHYLSGQVSRKEIVYETNIPNGYFVPCINLLENPSLLLEGEQLGNLLSELSSKYRFVIIDSPPIASVSDAALIATHCDGSILVVRSGETKKLVMKESVTQLKRTGCRIIGTILNRVDMNSRAYGYYGGYGKKYGEYHKTSTKTKVGK